MTVSDPYAPPTAALHPAQAAPTGQAAVVHRRGRRFLVALFAMLVVTGLLVLVNLAQWVALAQGQPIVAEGDEFATVEAFDGLLSLLWLALLVIAGFLWCFWIHRAYDNLRHIGNGFMRFSPGWAVGAWFVPILNLWRPYQVVADLWHRSTHGNLLEEGDERPEIPPRLLHWWLLWLLAGFAGRASGRLYERWPEAPSTEGVFLLTHVAMLWSGLLLVGIVREVIRGQRQAAVPQLP